MDNNGNVLSIDEKPEVPKSNQAVVGVYIFDETVFKKINTLTPLKEVNMKLPTFVIST